jgi:nucleoside permease NupC
VPVYGVYGAAISFALTKMASFLFAFVYLKKHFKITIDTGRFGAVFLLTALCSFLNYFINGWLYLGIITLILSGIGYYIYKTFRRHRMEQYLAVQKGADQIISG